MSPAGEWYPEDAFGNIMIPGIPPIPSLPNFIPLLYLPKENWMKPYDDPNPYTPREVWRDLTGGMAMAIAVHQQAGKLLVLLEESDWEKARELNEQIVDLVTRIQAGLNLPDDMKDYQPPPQPEYEYRIVRPGAVEGTWVPHVTNKSPAPYRTVGHAKAAISRPTRGKFKIQRRSVGEWEDHLEIER